MIKLNEHVKKYIELYEDGKILFNKERKQLIEYLKRDVLSDETLYFDDKQINEYIAFTEKWYFKLQPFQKFIAAFVFLYHEDGSNYYQDFLIMEGRGAGKNGFVSSLGHFLISEFNGIKGYNGSIVANSEEQATTSIKEIKEVIDSNEVLGKYFYATNTKIVGKQTKSELKYRTSNGNTKDGLRDGFVIFDEIHEYQDEKNVRVHISGLGKKKNPRIFYIGTDGYVRDGYIDKKKKQAQKVLAGNAKPDSMFPFICKLDNKDEMNDPTLWEKANPMLSNPRGDYAKGLFKQIQKDYDDLELNPSGMEEFLTKRMDLPSESMERSIAPWEEIEATNKPIPDVNGKEAIAAVDFASVRDFIAAAITFKDKGKIYTVVHQWATKPFVDKYLGYSRVPGEATPNKRIDIPLKEWEQKGLITIVNDSFLDPQLPLTWLSEMRRKYSIKKVIMDNYRAQIMRKLFEDAGFAVEIIRNPTAIDGLLATIIDDGFPRNKFIWGDNPLLRWNAWNVLVKIDSRGNKQYLKKEEIRRKTDGFKAFEYTLYRIDELTESNVGDAISLLSSLRF